MMDSVSVAEKIRYYTSDGHWSPEGLAEYLIGLLDCSTLREENEEWSRRYGALYEDAEKRTARNAELENALEFYADVSK